MLNLFMYAALTVLAAAPSGARDDGEKEEKTVFATPKAVDFSGIVVAPGRYIISLLDNQLVFTYENNMMVAKRIPATPSKSNKYYHFPHLEVLKKLPQVTLNYYSQDKYHSLTGKELAKYEAPDRNTTGQVKRSDSKVEVTDSGITDYRTDLKAALARLEPQVAHCEDLAIRRDAKFKDEKLTLCVCPIVQKWKLPPAASLYRKDRRFKKKTHGYSILVNNQGRVIDCSVWDKKAPAKPFDKDYTYEGDGTASQADSANK